MLNLGQPGTITVDGKAYSMGPRDALYIGRGSRQVTFRSDKPGEPAQFYLVSYPAHAAYPTAHARPADAEKVRLGAAATCNDRTINKYIHAGGIKSCQLVMGITSLAEGSIWNTMPCHTHARRSEVYLYFDLQARQPDRAPHGAAAGDAAPDGPGSARRSSRPAGPSTAPAGRRTTASPGPWAARTRSSPTWMRWR